VDKLGKAYTRQVDVLPAASVVREIGEKVEQGKMEDYLMEEGVKKFADPQHALLKLIGEKRSSLTVAK
jgi:transaldolase